MVWVGGDDVVQNAVHMAGEILHQPGTGLVGAPVDEDLQFPGIHQGGIPLAHLDKVDPNQGRTRGGHHLSVLLVPGDVSPKGLQHGTNGQIGAVVVDQGGGVNGDLPTVFQNVGLADGDLHHGAVFFCDGSAGVVVPGDFTAEGLQGHTEGDLGTTGLVNKWVAVGVVKGHGLAVQGNAHRLGGACCHRQAEAQGQQEGKDACFQAHRGTSLSVLARTAFL